MWNDEMENVTLNGSQNPLLCGEKFLCKIYSILRMKIPRHQKRGKLK